MYNTKCGRREELHSITLYVSIQGITQLYMISFEVVQISFAIAIKGHYDMHLFRPFRLYNALKFIKIKLA